jgi:hypothetical protein
MVTLPISPLTCSVLTTMSLNVTFYVGRWCGIKKVMNFMEREITKRYCEGDDDVMAKQGNRDRPNPRQCPSFEVVRLTGRQSTDSIREICLWVRTESVLSLSISPHNLVILWVLVPSGSLTEQNIDQTTASHPVYIFGLFPSEQRR